MTDMDKGAKITIRIETLDAARLNAEATGEDRSVSSVVRQALREHWANKAGRK
ncbi:MAG: ribbon-helix-helix protein, CopG family [Dehalococcoidia bacterium]|jgi:predicted HicB family RNase H-like nuclease